jgi:hypothetical protein
VNESAELSDSLFRVQESLGREVSKSYDDFGFYQLKLTNQVRRACFHFIRLGIAISGRTMLNDIGDKDFLARQVHGRQDFCE